MAKNIVYAFELIIFLDHQVATPDTDISNKISSEPGGKVSKQITLKVLIWLHV
jgi:hypothetical protein